MQDTTCIVFVSLEGLWLMWRVGLISVWMIMYWSGLLYSGSIHHVVKEELGGDLSEL